MNLLRKFASEINNKLILKKYENKNLQSRNYAFIALLQCSVAFSATDATTPVPLYYYKYNPPVVDGTNGPRKNPPHQLTLSVLFDHDNGQLIFEDPQGASCSYSVVCADGSIVTEGFWILRFRRLPMHT